MEWMIKAKLMPEAYTRNLLAARGKNVEPAHGAIAVNLHARLTHSGIELHPIYDPENTCIIQYIPRS